MTERLYYTCDETEMRALVVSCQSEADGRYAIELNQTLFHPQGGGQPADRGWIGGIAVEGVVARGDSVLHIVAQPLPHGEVEIRVDEAAGRLHSRLHSAGHLIGGGRAGWLAPGQGAPLARRRADNVHRYRVRHRAGGQCTAGDDRGLAGGKSAAASDF